MSIALARTRPIEAAYQPFVPALGAPHVRRSPFAIIDQVVSSAALDRASASVADVADALKGRLRAAVVDHSGVAVGRTVGGARSGRGGAGSGRVGAEQGTGGAEGGVAEADALPRGAAPELTLVVLLVALLGGTALVALYSFLFWRGVIH